MKIIYGSIFIFFLLFGTPLFIIISFLILISSGFPIFFTQKRVGKNGRVFNLYKFRTMMIDAEKQKNKLFKYNEADGPVFKINDDPRFTKFGKILSRTGLDELPQFLNILKGEMNIVGPRPLPVDEANKIPNKYKAREKVLPGIVSTWVVSGMHTIKFSKWMELDVDYANNSNIYTDMSIIYKSLIIVLKNIYMTFINYFKSK